MIAASLLPCDSSTAATASLCLSSASCGRAAVTFKLYKARNHHLCLSLGSHRITTRHLLTLRADLASLPSEIITFRSACISVNSPSSSSRFGPHSSAVTLVQLPPFVLAGCTCSPSGCPTCPVMISSPRSAAVSQDVWFSGCGIMQRRSPLIKNVLRVERRLVNLVFLNFK